ncbi:hypothetical protein [Salmonirosea aquatica]|uniref:Uncharacterized protein n=1 Tax=Salmonirosea aquatica TaxID=2654236 RepID=A0A7C9BN82_9BACT|nr:hypothetical protein [Cytophagaceae bacterium SJW1-29]
MNGSNSHPAFPSQVTDKTLVIRQPTEQSYRLSQVPLPKADPQVPTIHITGLRVRVGFPF